jgi:Mce-associated membrane protein
MSDIAEQHHLGCVEPTEGPLLGMTEETEEATTSDTVAPPNPKPTKAERLEAKAARLREAEEQRAARAAEAAATGRPAPPRRGLLIATALLSALCAALIALLLVVFVAWQHQRQVNSARNRALAAAKTFAIDFGSYDYRHLDADFREVATRMTASFAKNYTETSNRLKPTFVQYKTQVTAQIQGYGVTSASSSAATVVVFLDQRVLTSQSTTARIDRNRLEIHLVRQHGKWLVQKLLAK